MKKIIIYIACSYIISIQSKECIPTTFELALTHFNLLSTYQINAIDLASLTDIQFEAFKTLCKQLFLKEIASHSCSNQTDRFKAEIMMQKIGTYY